MCVCPSHKQEAMPYFSVHLNKSAPDMGRDTRSTDSFTGHHRSGARSPFPYAQENCLGWGRGRQTEAESSEIFKI